MRQPDRADRARRESVDQAGFPLKLGNLNHLQSGPHPFQITVIVPNVPILVLAAGALGLAIW